MLNTFIIKHQMTYDAEELSNSKQKLCMYFGKAVRLIFELSRSNQMMDWKKNVFNQNQYSTVENKERFGENRI